MKRSLLLSLTLLLVAGMAMPAKAATLENGSFEQGPDPSAYTVLSAGNTSVTGWEVETGSVDYVGSHWQASAGLRSLDLNGNEKGAVSQVIPTVDGATYYVTFYMSGNPDSGASLKKLSVSADGGQKKNYEYDTVSNETTREAMKWVKKVYKFEAAGTETKLVFSSEMDGAWGPALDNVVISREYSLIDKVKNIFGKEKNQARHEAIALCKNDGWKNYGDHEFKNQGACVSYFAKKDKQEAKADKSLNKSVAKLEKVQFKAEKQENKRNK